MLISRLSRNGKHKLTEYRTIRILNTYTMYENEDVALNSPRNIFCELFILICSYTDNKNKKSVDFAMQSNKNIEFFHNHVVSRLKEPNYFVYNIYPNRVNNLSF